MKLYDAKKYKEMESPTPKELYRIDILTKDDNAQDLNGLFGIMPGGIKGDYHYHKKRESIFVAVSGEAVELVDGEEIPIKAGDVFFIPPNEKHTIINKSDKEFRFLEFFSRPPVKADFHLVE